MPSGPPWPPNPPTCFDSESLPCHEAYPSHSDSSCEALGRTVDRRPATIAGSRGSGHLAEPREPGLSSPSREGLSVGFHSMLVTLSRVRGSRPRQVKCSQNIGLGAGVP